VKGLSRDENGSILNQIYHSSKLITKKWPAPFIDEGQLKKTEKEERKTPF